MRKLLLLAILFAGCSSSSSSSSTPVGFENHHLLEGEVVAVTDGDTIKVLDPNKEQIRVRLAEIDAPEQKQAFGTKSKEALSEKIGNKIVRVYWKKKDQWGRTIGCVYYGDRFINREMLQEGWAWQYKQYSTSPKIAEIETDARINKRGLWQDVNPVPPWEYRKGEKHGNAR